MSADEGEQYEVLRIVDERIKNGKRQFLVKWKDGSDKWSLDQYDEWKSEEETDCPDLIKEFREAREQEQLLKKKKKREDRKSRKSTGSKVEKTKDITSAPDSSDGDEDQPKKSKKKKTIIVSDEESGPSVPSKSDRGSKERRERSTSHTRRRSGKGNNCLEEENKSNLSGKSEEHDDNKELIKRDDRLFRNPSHIQKAPKTEIQSGEMDGNEDKRERERRWLEGEDIEINEIDNNMGSMTMDGQEKETVMVSVKEEPMKNDKAAVVSPREEEKNDHMNQLGDDQIMDAMDDNNEEMREQEDNDDNESIESEDVTEDDSNEESSDEIEQEQHIRRESGDMIWEEDEDISGFETDESEMEGAMEIDKSNAFIIPENGAEILGYRINPDKKGEIVEHRLVKLADGEIRRFYRVFFDDLNKSQMVAESAVQQYDPKGLKEYQQEYRIQQEELRVKRQARKYEDEVLRRNIEAAKKAEKERREKGSRRAF